jgi:hypothetical protein
MGATRVPVPIPVKRKINAVCNFGGTIPSIHQLPIPVSSAKRLFQIPDNILLRFDPDGNPH